MNPVKVSNRPSVLIISDKWNLPFHGGTYAAVRYLAYIFNAMNLSVYCAVLTMTKQEKRDAAENKVTLICPKPSGLMRWRTPNRDWFYSCDKYFPGINSLKNVRMLIGFAMVTSDCTFEIQQDLFNKAKRYIGYLWPSDLSSVRFVGCDKEELLHRLECLDEEIESVDAMVSVDKRTLHFLQRRYPDHLPKQCRIVPLPERKYLQFTEPLGIVKDDSDAWRILSILEAHDAKDMQSHKILAIALNIVAEKFDAVNRKPPQWRIIGVPEAQESYIQSNLNPHPHLNIFPSSTPKLRSMEREILSSQLILIPPSDEANSTHLMLIAMYIGIPFLVHKYSPCHDMIEEHFRDFEHNLVVDMNDVDMLVAEIGRVLKEPNVSWTTAKEVRDHLVNFVNPAIERDNKAFITRVQKDIGNVHPDAVCCCRAETTLQSKDKTYSVSHSFKWEWKLRSRNCDWCRSNIWFGAVSYKCQTCQSECHMSCYGDVMSSSSQVYEEYNAGDQGKGQGEEAHDHSAIEGNAIASDDDDGNERIAGQMTLEVNVNGAIPDDSQDIEIIERLYYSSNAVREVLPKKLNSLNDGMSVVKMKDACVSYVLQCETLDALECLWKTYETLKLKQLITSTTITRNTLKAIGALYLSIQTTLDIEEYELCRKELSEKDDSGKSTQPAIAEEQIEARDNVALTDGNRVLHAEVDALQSTITQLKVDLAILKERLDGKALEIENLKSDLDLKDKNEKVLMDKFIKANKNYNDLKDAKQMEERALADENHLLKEEVTSLKQKRDQLEEETISKQEELEKLKEEIVDKQGKNQKLMEEVANLKKDVNLLILKQNELEKLKKDNMEKQALADENRRLNEEVTSLKGELGQVEEKTELNSKELARLKEDNVEKQALADENQVLKTQVASLKEELGRHEEKTNQKEGLKEDNVEKQGQWSKTKTIEMKEPRGLTMTHLGQVVIACYGEHSVKTITSEDQLELELTFDGQFPKKFQPFAVAVSSTYKYFISDHGNLQVVVYDKVTKTVQTFCQGRKCRAIALMAGFFFVITNKTLAKCDMMNGVIASEVTGQIKPGLEITDLQDIVVDKSNNVIVSDSGLGNDGKILVFDCNLRFLRTLATQLVFVTGLDHDRYGNIYSIQLLRGSDRYVVKYRSDGLELDKIKTDDDYDFYGPRIAVSKVDAHRFAVSYHDRVDIYNL